MIWDDGAMFKGGYSGQGIFVDPGRDIVAVWYGTSGTDGQSHQLLPLIRKLSKGYDINRAVSGSWNRIRSSGSHRQRNGPAASDVRRAAGSQQTGNPRSCAGPC